MMTYKVLLQAITKVLIFQAFIVQCHDRIPSSTTHYYEPCESEPVELTEAEGNFTSPGWPGWYYRNQRCSWHITVKEGSRVELLVDIDWFNGDYIYVYDGVDDNAPLLAKETGRLRTVLLFSTGNEMFVFFWSSGSVQGSGFVANYMTVRPERCVRHDLIAEVGNFFSPGYPVPYENNTMCTWHIVMLDRSWDTSYYLLKLQVQIDSIEAHPNCAHDAIQVYDGADDSAPLLAKECGENKNITLISTGPELFVTFQSNDDVQGKGFVASFKDFVCEPQELTEAEGQFTSPGYPYKYNSDIRCTWHITVKEGSLVELHVHIISIEFNPWSDSYDFCVHDELNIYDGANARANHVAELCGNNKNITIRSRGNEMFIAFYSDDNGRRDGFIVNYETIIPVCDSQLTEAEGQFTSPGYPLKYNNNDYCTWHIKVKNGSLVKLHMQVQSIKSDDIYRGDCSDDVLQIYDGANYKAESLAKLCGNNKSETIFSSSNEMFIVFITNGDESGDGFIANYETFIPVCGHKELTEAEGEFTNPGYPGRYQTYERCTWLIRVKNGSHIELNVYIIELYPEAGLKVYDGKDTGSPQLAHFRTKLLGNRTITLISSGNEMFLLFPSSNRFTGLGFIVNYFAFIKDCGPEPVRLTKAEGQITHLGYYYKGDERCVWIITVKNGSHVQLHIHITDIHNTGVLMVHDGRSEKCPLLAEENGENKDITLFSSGNELFVMYLSDDGWNGRGFVANYVTISAACVGAPEELTEAEGQFTSPGYPEDYHENLKCTWRIKVKNGSRVELQLQIIDISDTDAIMVYDGRNRQSPLLAEEYGQNKTITLLSSGNDMFVMFKSGKRLTGRGFVASYVTISAVVTFPNGGQMQCLPSEPAQQCLPFQHYTFEESKS